MSKLPKDLIELFNSTKESRKVGNLDNLLEQCKANSKEIDREAGKNS